jgi:hypothetical protein
MEQQKVIFEKDEDYILKRNIMYYNIKKIIFDCIVEDEFEYRHMSHLGLTPRQKLNILPVLHNELNKFTENKCVEWCDKSSFNIMLGIAGFLDGLIKIKRINDFTAEEYTELIYNSIIYQLGNDEHSPALLEDIVIINNYSETE